MCHTGFIARPKLDFSLSAEQRSELNRLVGAPSTPQKIVRRARIALLAAEGKDNDVIATELKTSHVTVGLWRQRFLDLGLAGLQEAPRPGRPVGLDPAQVRKVLTEVVQPPQGSGRWSCRSMARHSGLSPASVQRLWAANDLKPHCSRTFKLSNDPQFEAKFLWACIWIHRRGRSSCAATKRVNARLWSALNQVCPWPRVISPRARTIITAWHPDSFCRPELSQRQNSGPTGAAPPSSGVAAVFARD